jgi:hypothetical protein
MKKILAALGIVAVTSTAALAGYQCQPTYYQAWDSYNQEYIMVRGRDRCYQTYQPQPYYSRPSYSTSSQDALIGGLLGFGLGYAFSNNHRHHHHHQYYRRPYH